MADLAFLDWPFFHESHRRLGRELDAWCRSELAGEHDEEDVDTACRSLVRKLGAAGWLRYCVPASHGGQLERIDVRSLSLIRETLARGLAAGPTFAHGITKTQLNTELAVSLETAIEMEAQAQAICMATNDFRRAFEAFAAKRNPEFQGD